MLRVRSALGTVAICLSVALHVEAQPVARLTVPAATFDHPFNSIAQIRELPDGRVLVFDEIEQSIYAVDAQFREQRAVGRRGRGPGEFTFPVQMIALSAGRTLIVDRDGSRLVEIDGALNRLNEFQWKDHTCQPKLFNAALRIQHADAADRLYIKAQPIRTGKNGERQVAREAAVEAWRTPCAVDTVAMLPAMLPPDPVVVGNSIVSRTATRGGIEPFSLGPQWVVTSNGTVVVAEAEPFRLRIIKQGAAEKTVPLKNEAVPVTEEIKADWRKRAQERQPAYVLTRGGQLSRRMEVAPFQEPDRWPKTLPPFSDSALVVAANGDIWLRRTSGLNADRTYEIFSEAGEMIRRVSIGPDRRVLGVGRKWIYVARTDGDGLVYLERFPVISR